MRSQKLRILALCSIVLTAGACKQNTKKENNSNNIQTAKVNQIEIKAEIEKWKAELVENKQIGNPCNYESLDSVNIQKWAKDNPGQIDGLPSDDKEIKSVRSDFNNDNKADLLLYFQGENCTGHNGGTKAYAKIIYSDGTIKSDLMTEIINTIQSEYNQKRKTNNNLKEITNDYLETTATINGYHNGIIGEFSLYTKNDAHCCPSYKGSYTYKLKKKSMEIEISKNHE
ncbi:hypothetical protein V5739_03405 [Salinimicrobium sp. TIG7-5_MAKvit]|uniref:hypothetical protein n=1 Tax=Salinimicrobium sp. TIG7-5_MAKvit TaxID=3121289 RepID=UPI003C6E0F9C